MEKLTIIVLLSATLLVGGGIFFIPFPLPNLSNTL